MSRLWNAFEANAVDLLFNLSAFLVIYVVARMIFRSRPLVAMSFAVLPLLVAYVIQHPAGPAQLLASLG